MSQSLADLEATRTRLLHQFLILGDFRPGNSPRRPFSYRNFIITTFYYGKALGTGAEV
jgi:hypothetical protein